MIFSVTISIVKEMYSDLEKSCKFLFLFVSVFVFFLWGGKHSSQRNSGGY